MTTRDAFSVVAIGVALLIAVIAIAVELRF
jgi:hypothetical protein